MFVCYDINVCLLRHIMKNRTNAHIIYKKKEEKKEKKYKNVFTLTRIFTISECAIFVVPNTWMLKEPILSGGSAKVGKIPLPSLWSSNKKHLIVIKNKQNTKAPSFVILQLLCSNIVLFHMNWSDTNKI
jgi:hypothetical protein